jgi:Uma2 family endonuclease
MTVTPIQGSPKEITQRITLHNVSWQTYKSLLADLGDRRASRLAYDQGVLEITMPSDLHEISKHLLERIVITLTEELNLRVRGVGSVTLDREDLQKGAEPDAGFYIQNARRIRGRRIDLSTDPPPDLVIEVDITSPSTQRQHIYKRLGIPEVWLCTQSGVQIFQLQNEEYAFCEYSLAFPILTAAAINHFLQQGETMEDDNAMIRELRIWVREQLQSQPN